MKKLGFGCMRFPTIEKNGQKEFDIEQIKDMVDSFLEQGFTYFDTAYVYSNSEVTLKQVLVDRYPREKYLLATKLPTSILTKDEDLQRIFDEQLDRTGAGYFDYYLIHCLNTKLYETATRFNAFEFAMQKKKEGKVKKVGFSFHDTADVLDKILNEHPETEFVQLQINYLDWEDGQVQSRKCYETALKHGKEVIIMEPVKGGTLANVPYKAQKLFNQLDKMQSVASWAIRFAAGLPNVIMVLSGMSSMEQMLDNTSYMKDFVPLSKNEQDTCFKVADIINSTVSVSCTACKYCVDGCPAKINIPEYFSIYNRANDNENALFDECRNDYFNLSKASGKISNCISCKQCESKCPQQIEIIKTLQRVLKTFEE